MQGNDQRSGMTDVHRLWVISKPYDSEPMIVASEMQDEYRH